MNFPEWFYTMDIVFAVLVLLFAVWGTRHGLAGEAAHVLTLTAVLYSLCFFFPQMVRGASSYWRGLPVAAVRIGVPVVVLLAAILFFFLVRAVLNRLLKKKLGEKADKIAGGTAGALRGALTGIALMTAAVSLFPDGALYQTISQKSSVGGWVCNTLMPWLQPRIMEMPFFNRGSGPEPDLLPDPDSRPDS
jgi:uncharacterized membrane protein required for colicin V production